MAVLNNLVRILKKLRTYIRSKSVPMPSSYSPPPSVQTTEEPLVSVTGNTKTRKNRELTSIPRYAVLEVLGVLAVITNCLLIGFSFEALAKILDYNNFKILGTIVCMEHGIMFIKYLISVLVPDTPGRIVKQIAFQEFCREQIIKKVTGVVDKKFEDETQDDDLNNVDHIIEEKQSANLLGFNIKPSDD
jgi:hypothetical protein